MRATTRSAQGVAPVFKEFSSGLVKLLHTAEWADSEVALLYSMPSNQISWMMDSEADGKSWNQRSDSYEPDHMSMFFSHVGWNKLPSMEVNFIIESFPQLTTLALQSLGLIGEHLCSTSNILIRACSPA